MLKLHRPGGCLPAPPVVEHRVLCLHQPEIEVWPASAEVYFRDERFIDPASSQVRFDAAVYNTPSRGIQWRVQAPGGGPGLGSIDASGLYTAPDKGGLANGTTEIVVATAADDPLRKAFARVTLIGRGPEPAPKPRIEVYPRHVSLYFKFGGKNHYIDNSNQRQLFKVDFYDTPEAGLRWTIHRPGHTETWLTFSPWFLYDGLAWPGLGVQQWTVDLTVSLQSNLLVSDTATISVNDYRWPPLP